MDSVFKIDGIGRMGTLDAETTGRAPGVDGEFADTLKDALQSVDQLQKESEAAQTAYANNEDVSLHDVLIKIEEAEIAFKTMMEVRNKLVEAYREIMRMGS